MLKKTSKSRPITTSANQSFPKKAVRKIGGGQTSMDLQNQWANLIIDEADKYARENAASRIAKNTTAPRRRLSTFGESRQTQR